MKWIVLNTVELFVSKKSIQIQPSIIIVDGRMATYILHHEKLN